jgi:hypothetical protein
VIKEPNQVHTKLVFTNEPVDAKLRSAIRACDKQAIRHSGLWLNLFGFGQFRKPQLVFAFALIIAAIMTGAHWAIQREQIKSSELAQLNYTQTDIPAMPSPTLDVSRSIPPPEKKAPVKTRRSSLVSFVVVPPAGVIRGPNIIPSVQTVSADPRSRVHLTFILPPDGKAGMYTIRLVDPYDKTLFETKAVSSRDRTVKLVVKPRTLSPGMHTFKLSSGESTVYYYLEIREK